MRYKLKWADMGNPSYAHPKEEGPDHIIGLTWDSALAKFGVDRGAGVWNDYGNPINPAFGLNSPTSPKGSPPYGRARHWRTDCPSSPPRLERDGVRYEVKQFAYPLERSASERRGDMPMVLLQRVRMTDISGEARVHFP